MYREETSQAGSLLLPFVPTGIIIYLSVLLYLGVNYDALPSYWVYLPNALSCIALSWFSLRLCLMHDGEMKFGQLIKYEFE